MSYTKITREDRSRVDVYEENWRKNRNPSRRKPTRSDWIGLAGNKSGAKSMAMFLLKKIKAGQISFHRNITFLITFKMEHPATVLVSLPYYLFNSHIVKSHLRH